MIFVHIWHSADLDAALQHGSLTAKRKRKSRILKRIFMRNCLFTEICWTGTEFYVSVFLLHRDFHWNLVRQNAKTSAMPVRRTPRLFDSLRKFHAFASACRLGFVRIVRNAGSGRKIEIFLVRQMFLFSWQAYADDIAVPSVYNDGIKTFFRETFDAGKHRSIAFSRHSVCRCELLRPFRVGSAKNQIAEVAVLRILSLELP